MKEQKDKMREQGVHKIEVHVAGICLREEEGHFKILVGKRTPNRQLFPDYWECGGGQVFKGEDFVTALKRQMKGEFNIDIIVEHPIGVYKIETNGTTIPGLRFICRPGDEAQEIVISDEFSESKWIDETEIDAHEFIPGLKEDISTALNLYRRMLAQTK
jgi:8-oxo-dGTP pyrophosphatase MutT (NUDIX family)